MRSNLLVSVIGHKRAGKTYTWDTLFGRPVKSGPTGSTKTRRLFFNDREFTRVLLVSGSAEERKKDIEVIIGGSEPRIVLCSVQYVPHGFDTLRHFVDRDYSLFVHWLNPGRKDTGKYDDVYGLVPWVLKEGGMIGIRNGKVNADERVGEMRDYIHGWASSRGLIRRLRSVAR